MAEQVKKSSVRELLVTVEACEDWPAGALAVFQLGGKGGWKYDEENGLWRKQIKADWNTE